MSALYEPARCVATSPAHPGAPGRPPRGRAAEPSGAATGLGGGVHESPPVPARWPADTVSQPPAGQVTGMPSGGTVLVESDATPPFPARFHRLGWRAASRSSHRSPGTPIRTTRPVREPEDDAEAGRAAVTTARSATSAAATRKRCRTAVDR